jgi:uncharacterized glyoxalase superfamily protein PhnB
LPTTCGKRQKWTTFFKKAINAGATILKESEDAFWGGYSWHFSDPGGRSWEIAWNPGFPMD